MAMIAYHSAAMVRPPTTMSFSVLDPCSRGILQSDQASPGRAWYGPSRTAALRRSFVAHGRVLALPLFCVLRRFGRRICTAREAERAEGREKSRRDDSTKKADDGLFDGIQNWVEEKKAQGSGGIGGAVLGGMVAGPLGAVAGAALGSKAGKFMKKGSDPESSKEEATEKKEGKGGLGRWIEEKKSQGTGSAAGTVVGGMVAGPLGAMVGAAVGSEFGKLVPDINDALDKMDPELASASSKRTESTQPNSGAISDQQSKPPIVDDASLEVLRKQMAEQRTAIPDSLLPSDSSAVVTTPARPAKRVSAASSPRRLKAVKAELEKAQEICLGAAARCDKLDVAMQKLYAEAQDALGAGREEDARAALASRAELGVQLEQMQRLREEGEELRVQKERELLLLQPVESSEILDELAALKQGLQESKKEAGGSVAESPNIEDEAKMTELARLKQDAQRQQAALESEANELYAKAEEKLQTGDEEGARALLAARQQIQAKLATLAGR